MRLCVEKTDKFTVVNYFYNLRLRLTFCVNFLKIIVKLTNSQTSEILSKIK